MRAAGVTPRRAKGNATPLFENGLGMPRTFSPSVVWLGLGYYIDNDKKIIYRRKNRNKKGIVKWNGKGKKETLFCHNAIFCD
uniref:Uncharacterized protein n=1 Tax=Candidatus Methanophaga sp. ANME-1 ERB7 TaxID=2759913 RepID=A0A7G9Z4M8_9EURY|nr:hypothetical protein MHJDHPNH_00014 [Methanosarcinales archaeon ANME-1 ERB7]